MKIGIFTETYHPTINGVVVSIDTFRREMEKRGHHYYIFAPQPSQATSKVKVPKDDAVFRFPSISFPHESIYPLALALPSPIAAQFFPLDLIKELDIIHIQHYSLMGQYGLGLAKRFNIPTVYTYHTMAELYAQYFPVVGALSEPFIRALTRSTAHRASHVITPTASVKKYLQRIGVKGPISILPTGIQTSQYHRVSKHYLEEHYHIPSNRNILLFVGRLAAEKNVHFLLKAFQVIAKKRTNTHLVLVGDGPDRESFVKTVAKMGLTARVTFTGFIDHKETLKLFGTGDIFAFPSVTDTQGIVILEAMAAGTIPVAVDRLGPHDIIKDGVSGKLTGLNLKDFSDTICHLLDNKVMRKKMAVAARYQAQQFDAAVTAQTLENLYEKLTDNHRS